MVPRLSREEVQPVWASPSSTRQAILNENDLKTRQKMIEYLCTKFALKWLLEVALLKEVPEIFIYSKFI